MEFEQYVYEENVKAKLFEEGDEHGFETRYYDPKEKREDGGVSTWSMGREEDEAIKIPYIENSKTRSLSKGFGREYLVEYADGSLELMDKNEFEARFTLNER